MSLLLQRARREARQRSHSPGGGTQNAPNNNHIKVSAVKTLQGLLKKCFRRTKKVRRGCSRAYTAATFTDTQKSRQFAEEATVDPMIVSTSICGHGDGVASTVTPVIDHVVHEVRQSLVIDPLATKFDKSLVEKTAADVDGSIHKDITQAPSMSPAKPNSRSTDSDGSSHFDESNQLLNTTPTPPSTPTSKHSEEKFTDTTYSDALFFPNRGDKDERLPINLSEVLVSDNQDQPSDSQGPITSSTDIGAHQPTTYLQLPHNEVRTSIIKCSVDFGTVAVVSETMREAGARNVKSESTVLEDSPSITLYKSGNSVARRAKASSSQRKAMSRAVRRAVNRAASKAIKIQERLNRENAGLKASLLSVQKDKTLLQKENHRIYEKWSIANVRYNDHIKDDDPATVAEMKDEVKKIKEECRLVNESAEEKDKAHSRDLEYQKSWHRAEVGELREKLEGSQEQVYQLTEERDRYSKQIVELLGQARTLFSKQQFEFAFQTKEAVLVGQVARLTQSCAEINKKRQEEQQVALEVSKDLRKTKDDFKQTTLYVDQLHARIQFLESRMQPMEFVGFPREQQEEMAKMERRVEYLDEQLTSAVLFIVRMISRNVDFAIQAELDSKNHSIQNLIRMNNSKVEEIQEVRMEKQALHFAYGQDKYFSMVLREDHEELEIKYNARSNDLQALRKQLANGDEDMANPNSWRALDKCSEDLEHARYRQKRAEEKLEKAQQEYDNFYEQGFALLASMWIQMWYFEDRCPPSTCPDYIIQIRGDVANLSKNLFKMDVNADDPDGEALSIEVVSEEDGEYLGPKSTPAAWLPSSNPCANGTENESEDVNLPEHQQCSDSSLDEPADIQDFANDQQSLIERLSTLVVLLWGRIWEFEALISPDYCEDRVWNDRRELVRQSYSHAGFYVNAVDLEDEADIPEPHGPLHTPDQWMPEDDDLEGLMNDGLDGDDDKDNAGNSDNNGDDDKEDGDGDDESDAGGVEVSQSLYDADVADGDLKGDVDNDKSGAYNGSTNEEILHDGHGTAADGNLSMHRNTGMHQGVDPDQGNNQGCQDHANISCNNSGMLDRAHEVHNGLEGDGNTDAALHRFNFSNVHSGYTTSAADAPITVGSYSWTPIEDVNFWGDLTVMFPYNHPELIRRRILANYEASRPLVPDIEMPVMSQPTSLNSCYADIDTSSSKNKGLDPKLYSKMQMSRRDPRALSSVPQFGLSQAQLDASVAECTLRMSQPSAFSSGLDGQLDEDDVQQIDDVFIGLVDLDVSALHSGQEVKKAVTARKQAERVSKLEEEFSEKRVQELEKFVIKWKASIERMQGR